MTDRLAEASFEYENRNFRRPDHQLNPPEQFQLTRTSKHQILWTDWLDLATRLENTSYFQMPDRVLSWWKQCEGNHLRWLQCGETHAASSRQPRF
jgi:hypothetical protein